MAKNKPISRSGLMRRRNAPLITPTDLGEEASADIAGGMNAILADVFALYVKTKNFHWHMSGSHFRDYHLLLDEHGEQIFAMTDDIAERARKLGGTTLHSISDISRHQRLKDNNEEFVTPKEMLADLDPAGGRWTQNWIDETERRTWFLSEIEHDV